MCVHSTNAPLSEGTHLLYGQCHTHILGQPCLNCVFTICCSTYPACCKSHTEHGGDAGGWSRPCIAAPTEQLLYCNPTRCSKPAIHSTSLKAKSLPCSPFAPQLYSHHTAAVELNAPVRAHAPPPTTMPVVTGRQPKHAWHCLVPTGVDGHTCVRCGRTHVCQVPGFSSP